MRRLALLTFSLTAMTAAAASAQTTFLYGGMHPVHPAAGGGFCADSNPHGHPYGVDPNLAYLYRVVNNQYLFVGNIYQFGYRGAAHPYYGHHNLPAIYGGQYCYLDGAHYHPFLPPSGFGHSYLMTNGYYTYTGVFPRAYHLFRGQYYRRYHTYFYSPAYRSYYRGYRSYVRRHYRPPAVAGVRTHYGPPRRTYYTTPVYRYAAPRTRVYTTRGRTWR